MPLPRLGDLPLIGLLGLSGITIYNLALNYGETQVTAGVASFIVGTVPIFTALISRLVLREVVGLTGWIGTAVSTLGLAVIALADSGGVRISGEVLAVLLAALCQALYFVLQKRLLTRYSALQLTTYCIVAGTIPLGLVGGDFMAAIRAAPAMETLAVVYLGLFPGALAYAVWAFVLSHISPGRAARGLYGVPPVAILTGWIWLGEIPTTASILGGVLAVGGVAIGRATVLRDAFVRGLRFGNSSIEPPTDGE